MSEKERVEKPDYHEMAVTRAVSQIESFLNKRQYSPSDSKSSLGLFGDAVETVMTERGELLETIEDLEEEVQGLQKEVQSRDEIITQLGAEAVGQIIETFK